MKAIPENLLPTFKAARLLAIRSGLSKPAANTLARSFVHQIWLKTPHREKVYNCIIEPYPANGILWIHLLHPVSTQKVERLLHHEVEERNLKGEWYVHAVKKKLKLNYTSYLCRPRRQVEKEVRLAKKAEESLNARKGFFTELDEMEPQEAKRRALEILKNLGVRV